MEQLSNNVMNEENRTKLQERIIQFGEGNFLRGFFDWMIHEMNERGVFNGSIVAIQPTPHGKVVPKLNKQDGLYTLILRGIQNGKVSETQQVITAISRGINPYSNWQDVLEVAENKDVDILVSNTTEAGLTYSKEDYDGKEAPLSFPGKVTAYLYHRYKTFSGASDAGMTILPCELVDGNGDLLKEIVMQISTDWMLPSEFMQWVETENTFCNTLVDRIVTGYPKEEIDAYREKLGYDDVLLVAGEPYHLFAIDGDKQVQKQLPFTEIGLNVKWGDITPYRELKVRLLNGTHTMMFAASYLYGVNTVLEAMEDPELLRFIERGLFDEIYPFVNMNEEEKTAFVKSVIERFQNPYNRHLLTDIGMNAIFKFKSRLGTIINQYEEKYNEQPRMMTFSLAALILYYRPVRKEGAFLIGERNGDQYTIRDNDDVLSLFEKAWASFDGSASSVKTVVQQILKDPSLFGLERNGIKQLEQEVSNNIKNILANGMKAELKKLVN